MAGQPKIPRNPPISATSADGAEKRRHFLETANKATFWWHATLGRYLKRKKTTQLVGEKIDPAGSRVGLVLGCEQID